MRKGGDLVNAAVHPLFGIKQVLRLGVVACAGRRQIRLRRRCELLLGNANCWTGGAAGYQKPHQ